MSFRTIVVVLLVARIASAGADSSFAAAKSAYEAKQLDVAAVQLEQFVTAFPTDPRVGEAAGMWLDTLGQDVAKFDHAIGVLLPLAAITGKDRERVERVAGGLAIKHAEDLAKAGQPLAAARKLVEAAKLVIEPKQHFEALFEAAVMFEQARDGNAAIATLHAALETKPLTPVQRGDALLHVARLEELTEPLLAANDFASVPNLCRDKRCRDSADAQFNAGRLFLALGRYKEATTAFASYVKDYPTEGDADRAALLLGHIADLLQDTAKAEAAYTAYLARAKPQQAEYASLRLGYAAAARGERAKADRAFLRAANPRSSNPELIGEAKLAHAELLAHDAANVKLTVRVQKLVAALEDRSRLIELAQRAYDDVATAHDDFWMIASLDRAAHLYDDLASALLTATPPALDNETDKHSYRNQIELFASGITNKVIEAYRAAYDTALATNVHSEHELDAWRQLNRLDPKRYPPAREAREGLRAEPAFVPAWIVLK